MSFFTSGSVDTRVIDRVKLRDGTYRVRLADFADHLGAFKGSRTQADFVVVEGPANLGARKSHTVSHTFDAPWKASRARGEIAAMLGAFMGLTRDTSGLKIDGKVFADNTRTVNYTNEGKDVASATRASEDLPLVKAAAECYLVVRPYEKNGKRVINEKSGRPSVIYDFYPLSAALTVSETGPDDEEDDGEDTGDPPEDDDGDDGLAAAQDDGWRMNPNSPGHYYKKGEAQQLTEAELRSRYE